MNATPYAYLLIRQFEGLRLEPYKCPAGVWTIGYGHTTSAINQQPITQLQAEQLLQQDIQQVETYLNDLNLNLPLTQNQFDALSSLIFNIGQQAFSKSSILKLSARILMIQTYQYNSSAGSCWYKVDDDLGRTYDALCRETDAYAMETLKGDDLHYYLSTLD